MAYLVPTDSKIKLNLQLFTKSYFGICTEFPFFSSLRTLNINDCSNASGTVISFKDRKNRKQYRDDQSWSHRVGPSPTLHVSPNYDKRSPERWRPHACEPQLQWVVELFDCTPMTKQNIRFPVNYVQILTPFSVICYHPKLKYLRDIVSTQFIRIFFEWSNPTPVWATV